MEPIAVLSIISIFRYGKFLVRNLSADICMYLIIYTLLYYTNIYNTYVLLDIFHN